LKACGIAMKSPFGPPPRRARGRGERRWFQLLAIGLGLVSFTPAANAEDSGKDLFKTFCASCHGVDGQGKTSPGHYYRIPDWTATDAVRKLKDEQIRKQIRTGKLQDRQSGMPAFGSLTDAQVDLLIAYVRKLSAGQRD
jgi:mono/diheme cytochrome c family protein